MTDQNQALPAQGSDANQQEEEQHVNNNNQTMESLLKDQDLNVDLPQPGEIRTGMIASISPSQILVSIGAKSEGVVSGRELDQLSAEEREALKVGQEVHVYVVHRLWSLVYHPTLKFYQYNDGNLLSILTLWLRSI